MQRDRLRLLPHDPAWQDDFLAEKCRIAAALQDGSVQIEHVGSTSIPAVQAKPILDLAILCGPRGVEPVAQALQTLGYAYRGRNGAAEGRYYAVLDRDNLRLCQAHIYSEPCADWHSQLCFRDVLRAHPDLAREYDEYKRRLADAVPDKAEYARIKSQWVDTFILKIYARKANVSASPGLESGNSRMSFGNIALGNIVLRPAIQGDADAVADVYLASRRAFLAFAPLAHSDDEVRAWIAEVVLPGGGITVAVQENTVVGMMATRHEDGVGWIEHFYLAPGFTGSGIGSLLLARAMSALGPPVHVPGQQRRAALLRAARIYGDEAR